MDIFEKLEKDGNYANVTLFRKDEAAKEFNFTGEIVATSMGPDASPSLIQFTDEDMLSVGTSKDGVYSTKDGFTLLNKIRHNNKYIQALINTSLDPSKLNNDTSGDGTTTSYVLFAKLFYNIYNNTYKQFVETKKPKGISRRLTDGQFSKLLRKTIKMICKRIDDIQRHPITDYDKLIDIARISLNNDDQNLKPIQALLTTLKTAGVPAQSVSISIANSNNNKSSFSVNSGFELPSKVYLRDQNTISLENTRLIVLERNLDTHDQTNAITNLIEATRDHFEATGERFIVLMNSIDERFIPYLESYYRNYESLYSDVESPQRHLFLCAYPQTNGIPLPMYLEDMLIYFNSSFYNITEAEIENAIQNEARIEYGKYIQTYLSAFNKGTVEELGYTLTTEQIADGTPENMALRKVFFDKYNNLTYSEKIRSIIFKDKFDRLPMVVVDNATNNYMTIIKKDTNITMMRNEPTLAARINEIKELSEKTTSINEKEICIKRFSNLVQQYAVITIGGPTESERELLYSANLDATLAVNSAARVGIVSGMCIPTSLAAQDFLVDLIKNENRLTEYYEYVELTDTEKFILKETLLYDIVISANFIFDSICRNADIESVEIEKLKVEIAGVYFDKVMAGEKFAPMAYDVLAYEYTDKVISPYESEKSYINAGLLTCITFMTAKLFLHPNEYFTNNVKK